MLTALSRSDRLMAYLENWHVPQEYNVNDNIKSNSAHLLHHIYAIRQALNRSDAAALRTAVAQFWRSTGYQTGYSSQNAIRILPLEYWGASVRCGGAAEGEHQDPVDYLFWLMDSIQQQLGLGAESAQDNFNWTTRFTTVTRMALYDPCRVCGRLRVERCSQHEEPILTLRLPFPDDKKGPQSLDLSQVIANHMQHAVNDWKCPDCKTEAKASKVLRFQHLPAVLAINIVRALSTTGLPGAADAAKNLVAITIPLTLDMSRWLNNHESGKGSKVSYKLMAVVSHAPLGQQNGKGIDSGHYVSYVKGTQKGPEWLCMNDNKVSSSSLSAFDDSKAKDYRGQKFNSRFTPYILIYDRDFDNDDIKPGRQPFNIPVFEGPEPQNISVTTVPVTQDHATSGQPAGGAAPVQADDQVATKAPSDSLAGIDVSDHVTNQPRDSDDATTQTNGGMSQPGAPSTAASPIAGSQPCHQKNQGPPQSVPSLVNPAVTATDKTAEKTTDQTADFDSPPLSPVDLVFIEQYESKFKATDKTTGQITDADSPPLSPVDLAFVERYERTFKGASEDVKWPEAELLVSVTVGDGVFELPKHFIEHFNKNQARTIEINASLRVPTRDAKANEGVQESERHYVTMDVAKAHNDAEGDRRERASRGEPSDLQPPRDWTTRWKRDRAKASKRVKAEKPAKSSRTSRPARKGVRKPKREKKEKKK